MPSTIRSSFRVKNVENFIHSLHENENTLYIGIGRPQFWDVNASSDGTIPVPHNNIQSENSDWSDLMHLKKIGGSNISHGIARRKWQANEKYDAYRDDWTGSRESVVGGIYPNDISESKYYTVTDNGTVFICVKQGFASDGTVVPSVQSPQDGSSTVSTGVTFAVTSGLVITSDGYIWKKVSTLTASDSTSFLTSDFTPIKTYHDNPGTSDAAAADQWLSQTNSATHGGGVYNINVTSSATWTGFSGVYHIVNAKAGTVQGNATKILAAKGDGVGLKYIAVFGDNLLKNVIVTDPGFGYTWVEFSFGTGSATLEAIYTPQRGIGVDPVKDLSAHNMILNSSFVADENDGAVDLAHRDFTVTNEYRKVVLVSNPRLQNGTLATAARLDMTHYMEYTGTTPAPDVIITQDTPQVKGRVVDASADKLRVLKINSPESVAETASDPEADFANGAYTFSGGTLTVSSILEPEVKFGSGDIIYTDYRRPILRDINQSEDIKIVVEY